MERLCIYVIYDKENIVDRYIGYMLKELRTCVSHLVVICNMPNISYGMEYIEGYVDEIFFRENKGYDAGAYKDALYQLIGWEKVKKYDELLLVNDSFFGPFIPMRDVFDKMQDRKCDFWGLTKYYKCSNYPEHLQSFFLVIRKRMLCSDCFKAFWKEMKYYTSLKLVIRNFETKFTNHFYNQGFQYDCLADMEANVSLSGKNSFVQYTALPHELIIKRNFPFVKRKSLIKSCIGYQSQEKIRLSLDYIKNRTNYDIGMILEKLIRECDNATLQWALGLRYIISSDNEINKIIEKNYVIVLIVSELSAYEYIDDYVKESTLKEQILICALNNDVAEMYQRNGYQVFDFIDMDFSKLLQKIQEFEFICIIQDEDVSSEIYPSFRGKSLFFRKLENLVKNPQYIQKVIKKFREDPYLGALLVPNSNFGEFFVSFAEERECFKFESFWIRNDILKKNVYDSKILWPSCVNSLDKDLRSQRYYFGIVESTEYAAMNEENMQLYLSYICSTVKKRYGEFKNLKEMDLLLYCGSYKQVYVYGIGGMARRFSQFIRNIKAYVVSDGQPKEEKFNGYQVEYLSDIKVDETIGMVVCLNEENTDQVILLLRSVGIKDYFLCAGE